MNLTDTIVAISSGAGAAARMIVRVSGPAAHGVAGSLSSEDQVHPAAARRVVLSFQNLSVPAWLYAFRAPRSYTGDDLVEFHLPGNPLLARMLLSDVLARGARQADPGEFTARAYFNGRMDLAEAEGVAATIAAHSEGELLAARQLLAGELARRLRPAMDLLAETLALVEVGIDFSDEDVAFLPGDEVARRAAEVDARLAGLAAGTARFDRLSHEPRVVLVGRPNAGKSSLLNALAGQERAVVSPVAGTTRDAVSAELRLARGMVQLIDVAGLEEDAETSFARDCSPEADVARQMRGRALGAVETADLVVLVRDPHEPGDALALSRAPDLIVCSKLDLPGPAGGAAFSDRVPVVSVSARTGQNLDLLRARLDALAFGADAARPALALNARHLACIDGAREALARVATSVGAGPEIVAADLRDALDELGQILGQVCPDQLLGRIFSAFCIGK